MFSGQFSVQAPNITFTTLSDCMRAKTLQNKILDLTRPDADATHITKCVRMVKDVQA
jgi:hypothetical protein